MPAYYRSLVSKFTDSSDSEILSSLIQMNARSGLDTVPQQAFTWEAQLPFLRTALLNLCRAVPSAKSWSVFLEFWIPLVNKRIDFLLVSPSDITVIELKTGTSIQSAQSQVEDYSLNLACFHEGSHGARIRPIVATESISHSRRLVHESELFEECRITTLANLGETLIEMYSGGIQQKTVIDVERWANSVYKVVPPIVEAARALYKKANVTELQHSYASKRELEATTGAIIEAVNLAEQKQKHVICFVTGVPGAGKTLVGLDFVHRSGLGDAGLFLSGNGPLVRVMSEALVRDVLHRERLKPTKPNRNRAEAKVRAFIRDAHDFTVEFSDSNKVPAQNVLVFDEAQRAWTAKQVASWSKRRKKIRADGSEPENLLQILERKPWGAIVALVGNGQEINTGEAGISEWGVALKKHKRWEVLAPPSALKGAGYEYSIFDNPADFAERTTEAPRLHLEVNRRSIRAERLNHWVEAVLAGRQEEARQIASEMEPCPLICRDIGLARRWLCLNRVGSTRSGLVASSRAVRLRADGVEVDFNFLNRFDWPRWFLNYESCFEVDCEHYYCGDVNSSRQHEIAATQFKIQGLELDWVALLWGEDLLWNGSGWVTRAYDGKNWKEKSPDGSQSQQEKRKFIINGYRVLMTRARQGTIIYIPKVLDNASSRLAGELDLTSDYLEACGAKPRLI